jgi:O-antigen/teichoic acid export membrane protein
MQVPPDIAQRSITSVAWNISSHIVYVAAGFVRSWLLARWLPVEVFGVYGLAQSVLALSGMFADFGMGSAFLHRAPETQDEDQAAAVHFTLTLLFTLVWATLMAVGAFVFARGETRMALLVLTATESGIHLTNTPYLILVRRVMHRRLALLRIFSALLITLVTVGLAWQGATLWALLAVGIVGLVLKIALLYVWRPVWRPRLAWSPSIMRYFLRFGSHSVLAEVLLRALDRVDDLWTGIYLGEMSLGFYSRAYTFATYPRGVLATPVNLVAGGTYAELRGDRARLSRAFVYTNVLLLRSGFFLAGLIALVAPEFIRLMLGAKWLPMLAAFRLMLVFTLLDPIKMTVAWLFMAVGRPDQVMKARVVQLVVLMAGLILLGLPLGVAGVALAVDVMLVAGMAILLWQARTYVDFSLGGLFAVPGLALLLGLLLSLGARALPGVDGCDWRTGFVKVMVFSAVYGVILLALERRQLRAAVSLLTRNLFVNMGGKALMSPSKKECRS